MNIEKFVTELSKIPGDDMTENPYYGDSEQAAANRYNLSGYLNMVKKSRGKKILFVGDTPSHIEGIKTGLPFTDEFSLTDPANDGLFDFTPKCLGEAKDNSIQAIWEVAREVGFIPALWNVFPFHPHLKYTPESNRAPRPSEIEEIGEVFLKHLIGILGVEKIYPIGNTADVFLSKMDLGSVARGTKIRHPSYGGKEECKARMLEIIRTEM